VFNFDKSKLIPGIRNLNNARVLVIGDFAIDEMIYGHTHRMSREAPVLILKHSHTKIILGAASNAAHNIATLNSGKVATIGIYGDDYHGPVLLNTLKNAGIDTNYMVMDTERVTTTKTRISGMATQSIIQQIVRIDSEVNEPISSSTEAKIIDNINKCAPSFDAILLSDYGIGIMTPAVIDAATKAAKKYNLYVAADSQINLSRFKDVTVLTPNQPDAEKDLGYELKDRESLLKGGQELLDKTNAEMILITRGSEGMVLFEKNGNISDIPVFNKTDVFDVTGAGDTVVSAFTLGLSTGSTPTEAAIIGNLAASIAVRHFGCATTTIPELEEALNHIEVPEIQPYGQKS